MYNKKYRASTKGKEHKKGYLEKNKDNIKERNRIYFESNKDEILKKTKIIQLITQRRKNFMMKTTTIKIEKQKMKKADNTIKKIKI